MEGGDRKWPQLDVLDLAVALESRDRRPGKLGRAHREEAPHRLLAEPAQRELDHRRRRSVEPVNVVDRAHDLRLAGERAQEREEARADDATLRRSCRSGAQQRGVETHPLWLGQSREELVRQVGEQIREPCEPEPGFRLRRPRDQHPGTLRTSQLDAHLPQRCLADSRLTHDRDHTGPLGAEEGLDGPQLRFAPDQARHGQKVMCRQADRGRP